jgi:hypothetical protein
MNGVELQPRKWDMSIFSSFCSRKSGELRRLRAVVIASTMYVSIIAAIAADAWRRTVVRGCMLGVLILLTRKGNVAPVKN